MVRLSDAVEEWCASTGLTEKEALYAIAASTPDERGCRTQEERKQWYAIVRAARRRLEALAIVGEFIHDEKTESITHVPTDHLGEQWMARIKAQG